MTPEQIQEQAEKFVKEELELKHKTLHQHDCIVSFIEGAKWMQEQDKWISVKDSLPNHSEEFNCVQDIQDGFNKPVSTTMEYYSTTKKWVYPGTYVEADNITHWQPLPQPPKQD